MRALLVAALVAWAAPAGAQRVVAIGDLHGDLAAARRALRLAGAIDAEDRWVGGALVVVQTGDLLDRGDDEPELLALFERLERDAAAAGGKVVALNGNHELMNAAGDLRYVTADGLRDYGGDSQRRRAFAPGGAIARRLALRGLFAIVGDALFAHAGVLPRQVPELHALDEEARAWLRGESTQLPRALIDQDSPVWTRIYGFEETPRACAAARAVLGALKLRRMVVAHTTQREGINAICDGHVWRIDVGLARRYGGPTQVLELSRGRARVLKAKD